MMPPQVAFVWRLASGVWRLASGVWRLPHRIPPACEKPAGVLNSAMNTPVPPEPLPTTEEAQRLMTAALVGGLLAAAAALLLFTWLGREVLEGEALRLDIRGRTLAQGWASPTLTGVMIAASFYGGPVVLIPAALVAAFAFLVHGWHRGALLVVLTVAGAALLNWLLKVTFTPVLPRAFSVDWQPCSPHD